jgi:hypothetical protein
MNYQDEVLRQLQEQTRLLSTISQQLGELLRSAAASLGYRRPLSEYRRFDWSSINAQVIERDGLGAKEVEYYSHRYFRHAAGGKFGRAIWFSRPAGPSIDSGRGGGDPTGYAMLIKFSERHGEADPVPDDVIRAAGSS